MFLYVYIYIYIYICTRTRVGPCMFTKVLLFDSYSEWTTTLSGWLSLRGPCAPPAPHPHRHLSTCLSVGGRVPSKVEHRITEATRNQ